MVTQFLELSVATSLNPVPAILETLMAWMPSAWAGTSVPALATLLTILSGLCAFAFPFVYRRYLGILGASAKRKGTLERQYYDRLRDSLARGNIAARLYATRLTAFLDWIDCFFGDVETPEKTLFPGAFGLRTPAALWTAPAFDRCLLIGLVYPVAIIFLVWVISGHVSLAEATLELRGGVPGWRRTAELLIHLASLLALWQVLKTTTFNLRTALWLLVGALSSAMGLEVGSNHVAASILIISGASFALYAFSAQKGTIIQQVPLGHFVLIFLFSFVTIMELEVALHFDQPALGTIYRNIITSVALAIAIIIAYSGACLARLTFQSRRGVTFLITANLAMIMACLVFSNAFAGSPMWHKDGPFLLFFVLLALLNVTFDWISLGLTRALLRRGIELGAWWPYLLALVDATLAALIIVVLVIVMVVSVQAFDIFSTQDSVLPLLPLFDGIASTPAAPEYWWIYALLLSTMIPSLLNLMIGGASFLRGIPLLSSLLLYFMPLGKAVPTFDRHWLALVLSSQMFFGAALGVLAQAFFTAIIIVYLLPYFGLSLLGMAHEIAEFNLPLRVAQFLAGQA